MGGWLQGTPSKVKVEKYNPHHVPGGSKGGQFTSGGGGASSPKSSKDHERAAARTAASAAEAAGTHAFNLPNHGFGDVEALRAHIGDVHNRTAQSFVEMKQHKQLHAGEPKKILIPPPGLDSGLVRETMSGHRPLADIASDIRRDWGAKTNYGAKPYLAAMGSLHDIKDNYGADSAESVVAYFLSNATSWRGEKARAIKAELKAILKKKSASHTVPWQGRPPR